MRLPAPACESDSTLRGIVDFVRSETRFRGKIEATMSLQDDLLLAGDDVDELVEDFAKRFHVDLSGYLWYFHREDEGWPNFGALFFDPPHARVQRIPITIELLRESAERGVWAVKYPEHEVPRRRYDILVNQVLAIGFVSGLLFFFVSKFLR